MARNEYPVAEYATNIRAIYALATDADRAAGAAWYPTAYRMADAIAATTGAPTDRVAAAIAALSPRNPWRWNVQDAAAFAVAAATGAPMPTATTFRSNAVRAWQFLTGATDWRSSALKVRSFVANICGDPNAVTVDVWAVRVATNGAESEVRTDAHYRAIAGAYQAVAAELGIAPRDLQAITWLVAERIGLGSARKGRGHAVNFKRGTFPWVAALFVGA